MNIATPHQHYTRAITEQVLCAPVDFARQLRETAARIDAGHKSGKLLLTDIGYMTPADLASRVAIDGGYFYPTLSCGLDVDALASGGAL